MFISSLGKKFLYILAALAFGYDKDNFMSPDDLNSEELPDDPEAAFLVLEEEFRAALLLLKNPSKKDYYEYFSRIAGAKDELKIDALGNYDPPRLSQQLYVFEEEFITVQGTIARLKTRIHVRNSRRNRTYSVHFDHATKQKIRHLLSQI